MTELRHRPCPVVLAAPSGTGKTTIAHELVARHERFTFSVSATTREAREGERDGIDYEFLPEGEFRRLAEEGELLEWAEVHGNLYGTPRRNLEAAQQRGQHVVLDIDVQGARQIRDRAPEAVLVFIFPPSARDLVARLTDRGTELADDVRRRLTGARDELQAAAEFDYIVVNDELGPAVEAVRGIVEAESHRPGRAQDLAGEIRRLREEVDRVLASGGVPVPDRDA